MTKKSIIKKVVVVVMVVIFAGFSGVFAAGEDRADGFTVTVVDDLNREIRLEKKPERIISLSPNITEILFALGLDEEIVGVTTYADYPEAALEKEKIGTIVEPNIEKIISLKPDLVFAAGINKLETVFTLKKLGIKVAGFNPTRVNDIFVTIKKIGKLTGKSKEARAMVTSMYIEMAEIQELVDAALKDRPRPRVFYEIWSDPLYTAGKNTFIDDVINLAGGVNIGAKAPGKWPQFNLEQLLIENPDVYISSLHSAPGKVTVEKIKKRTGYSSLKAVKNNRVYIVDQNLVSRPSPRIIKGLKEFVKALFPELRDKINDM
ncbi:ABC transporter substrate-binding protein [Halothermothrix orenii]|uniref:Periplasmic binding protein n=1 Tax=Halothermothrix orenii (strain H 168 / OCM 544 / DSM 9562) TaxID=373903 RepID=B8CZC8_HALOH|nr:cobalamin-binding protein [Halothermothrix orenii]ACL70647.1 periplasmic binding protein [Halothermothrix orenii H 168]